MTGPMLLLAVPAAVVGFIALRVTDTGGFGTFLFFGKAHAFEFNYPLGIASALLALAALGLGWAAYGKRSISLEPLKARLGGLNRIIENKYYLDDLYQWTIDRIILLVAKAVALFDRIIVNDTGVDGPAKSVRWSGGIIRYHITGRMYNYALGMVIGGIFVALFWWLLTTR